jgi:hypothetical protein
LIRARNSKIRQRHARRAADERRPSACSSNSRASSDEAMPCGPGRDRWPGPSLAVRCRPLCPLALRKHSSVRERVRSPPLATACPTRVGKRVRRPTGQLLQARPRVSLFVSRESGRGQGGPSRARPAEQEGEHWGGDITKATLPDRFLVDYVRVYDSVDAR